MGRRSVSLMRWFQTGYLPAKSLLVSFDKSEETGQPNGEVLKPNGLTSILRSIINRETPRGALVHHPDGLIEGASDPRSDGAAVGI